MDLLPLYLGPAQRKLIVESVEPKDLDGSCQGCVRHIGARVVCLPAEGEAGGVLVVGDGPTLHEDSSRRPFTSAVGTYLRQEIAEHWTGPLAFDNAVRCRGKQQPEGNEDVDACRPYLAQTLAEVRPQRIIALGARAIYSLLGRDVPVHSVRRGYAWTSEGVPVFMLLHPVSVVGQRANRHLRAWFEEDLKWALTAEVPVPVQAGSVARVVLSEADALAAEAEALEAGWFAFDCETAGNQFDTDFTLLCLSTCAANKLDAWVWDAGALALASTRAPLVRMLTNKRIGKVGQNTKYDTLSVRCALGVAVEPVVGDTRLARKLLEPEAAGDLETMAELVGMGGHKGEAQAALEIAVKAIREVHRGKDTKLSALALSIDLDPAIDAAIRLGDDPMRHAFALLPRPVLLRYNARDTVATARLHEVLMARIAEEPALDRIWNSVILPAANAFEQVEAWGVGFDSDAANALLKRLVMDLAELRKRFDTYGATFNPDSSKQVGELLYQRLRLRCPSFTKGGAPSTDRATLELLSKKNGVAADLLAWRKLSKLKGTYAEGLPGYVRGDGRIHPNIKLDGARSGRTSCTGPNLQQVPRAKDSTDGKLIRDCFRASPGTVLLEIDYSQVELRVAAMLSGDTVMRDIFLSGDDYHLRTAQLVAKQAWGINADEVEDRHRSIAKTFNFMLLYGGSDGALAAAVGCSLDEAARIREAILGKFKQLAKWADEQLIQAQRTGYVWTWWAGHKARRRSMWQIAEHDGLDRSKAEHGAINSPVQGTASDFCLASVAAVVQWIKDDCVPAKLVLAIHDALLLEVEVAALDETAHQVRRLMTSWQTLNGVPLEVDAKVGTTWGSMSKYVFSPVG